MYIRICGRLVFFKIENKYCRWFIVCIFYIIGVDVVFRKYKNGKLIDISYYELWFVF